MKALRSIRDRHKPCRVAAQSTARRGAATFAFVALMLLLGGPASLRAQQPDAAPVNADATPEARALLREIDSVSGHAILSGEHNYPNTGSLYSDRVFDLTGKYPAIFGQDFGFAGGDDKDSTLSRPAMIREVIRQYRAGAVPALCWHEVPPTESEPVTFTGSILSHLTDAQFHQLLTPGTEIHKHWEQQVDVVAGYLGELQEAHVPVLFRPYHEMNGNWFWWGNRPGAEGSAALYRMLFDRFVHVHHLNNILWVWNVAAASSKSSPPAPYFPGAAYVDIVSMDTYRPFAQSDYESMLAIAGAHKPIALAEVGTLPTPEVLAKQPRWAYLMVWSEFETDHNTLEGLQQFFRSPHTINRGDVQRQAPQFDPPTDVAPHNLSNVPAAH
jgi:mannan endo-1,4-beta-mannosidase